MLFVLVMQELPLSGFPLVYYSDSILVGKSTLLNKITETKSEIGAYEVFVVLPYYSLPH